MAVIGPIEDQLAINALVDAYSDAVFRRDAQDWGGCWAQDARWSLMGTTVAGREAIVAMWVQAMDGFSFVAFFAQIGALLIDGDRANGRIWTHEVLEDREGNVTRPVGRYDDEYVRTSEGWRFASRAYTMLKG